MATTHPDGFKSIVEGQYQELGWRKVECRATSRLVAGSRYEIAASQEGYEILGIKLISLDKLSLTNWFGITLELRKVK